MGIFNFLKSKRKSLITEENNYKIWQSIVCRGNVNPLLSKEELLSISSEFINDSIRIINDCTKLINETTSISVYFSRYNLLIEKMSELSSLEPFIKFNAPTPSTQLQQILSEKDLRSKMMLQRAWDNVKLKILDLKTDKAKLRNINNFFETAYSNISSLGTESTKFLAKIKKDSETLLSNNEKDNLSDIKFDEFKEKTLLSELNNCTNAYDRHFSYMELQNFYYKYRNLDTVYLNKCIDYCLLDINSLDQLNNAYIQQQIKLEKEVMQYICSKNELQKRLQKIQDTGFEGSIPAFKRLAIIYEKKKEYKKAIEICKQAIEYGEESDGTKNGFRGRLEKLNSKIH